MIPRTWRAHKNKAALLIQRYMKGYHSFYKNNDDIRAKKLEINFAFFDSMKTNHRN